MLSDVIFVLSTIVAIFLLLAYVQACERLR